MIKVLEKHSWISWILVAIIVITIFYMSSLTFESQGGKGFGWKTIVYHFGIFFFLSFFLHNALVKGKYEWFILIAVLISIVYGISDEFHQMFVPGRACTFDDVMVDSCGILSASFIYSIVLSFRKQKEYKNKYL
jgi:VanZ family protein